MKNIIKMLFVMFFIIPFSIFSTARSNTFQKFPNEYFVETGTYLGEGVLLALNAGFKHVYSIELSPDLYKNCLKKFQNSSRVKLFLGSSENLLENVIRNINKPITFWLDAHYSGGNTAKGIEFSPIMKELEIIKNHPIKTHTILIDDVRCMGGQGFDFVTLDQIINKILEINPKYKISFESGFIEDDILVAQIL
jgi:hypothetical protein